MAKKNLFDEDDSASEGISGGADAADLKINEDYARRFEHNKKREERQRRKLFTTSYFCATAPTVDVELERNQLQAGRNLSIGPCHHRLRSLRNHQQRQFHSRVFISC
jgi:hypothetical protein